MIEGFTDSDLDDSTYQAKERAGVAELYLNEMSVLINAYLALKAGGEISSEVWKRGLEYHKRGLKNNYAWIHEQWALIISGGKKKVLLALKKMIEDPSSYHELLTSSPFFVLDEVKKAHDFKPDISQYLTLSK